MYKDEDRILILAACIIGGADYRQGDNRVHITTLLWACCFYSLNFSILIGKMGRISCAMYSRFV